MQNNKLEWENAYRSSSARHKNIYPSEMVVSWINRNCRAKWGGAVSTWAAEQEII